MQDPLIIAKLEFFASVASTMMPYLEKFQADTPLLPFVTTELSVLLDILMRKFIKQSEMDEANSPAKMIKFNVEAPAIHVTTSEVDIGFAATNTLQTALREKKVSQLQALEFRSECCAMLVAIVTKIQERGPLKYNFARKLASWDQRLIVAECESAVKMFKQVLAKLIDTKWRTAEEADTIFIEYKKFVSDANWFHHEKFTEFSLAKDRLDLFFFEALNSEKTYTNLWNLIKFLLTLSHGHAAVE